MGKEKYVFRSRGRENGPSQVNTLDESTEISGTNYTPPELISTISRPACLLKIHTYLTWLVALNNLGNGFYLLASLMKSFVIMSFSAVPRFIADVAKLLWLSVRSGYSSNL